MSIWVKAFKRREQVRRQDAENIITEYLKPIFGFALKRCKSTQDAEDLSQEIVLKAYRALLAKDDVGDAGKFIWTIAHNALCNYYRDSAASMIGVPIDDFAEILADPDAQQDPDGNAETITRLQREIAYLSKLQRKIVIMYYFENRKQADIASELGIPVGTVKWHLFEAKKELKRGMDTMRKTSELKFHPIKFDGYGINGSVGSRNPDEFFRSSLPQNICYCVRNAAKTVNEIADDLGVSPVYVETEVDVLEEYGFLVKQKDKYLINFCIVEPTAEQLTMQNDMYKQAAELFANDLFDELTCSKILDDERIFCNYTQPDSTKDHPKRDKNFLLWSLIPYIAAWSGEDLIDKSISFDEVATIRPDGGHNIFHASVISDDMVLPEDYVHMKNWCGPMWNEYGGKVLWQIDSEWSNRGDYKGFFVYADDAKRVLSLYDHERENLLTKEDYAWLSERGYIKTWGDYDGCFKTAWKIVVLTDKDVQRELLAIGERIKLKYREQFDALKAPYAKAVIDSVPAHLQKIKQFELQYVFHSDGWFLLHCIVTLLNNGKLKLPTEEQRKALTTMIIPS
ncbi:MAG: RNA polymerase sigma factor [Ruminococcaceae bacterium]|nr:RNA polymerase sigma factor [Oscillospiraceae bacterium]